MFTFINILKNFENKISQTEMIESQYISREYYQNENFHLNAFSKVILNKIKDSSNLIKILNSNINEINDEILNQINSNFSNHLILISKIQTVDFLIENIEKPLYIIQKKIKNKLNALDKNENEIQSIIDYLKKNEKSLRFTKIYFSFYKLYAQAIILEKSINEIEVSTTFKNILENSENTTILVAFDFLKTYLIQTFRFLTLNNKMERMINSLQDNYTDNDFHYNSEKLNENKDKSCLFDSIDNIDGHLSINKIIKSMNMNRAGYDIRFSFIDKFLERCLNELIPKVSCIEKEDIHLYKTLLKLIYDCYRTIPKLKHFYEKIKESFFKKDINDVISIEATKLDILHVNSNSTKIIRFSNLEDILKNKYFFIYDICRDSKLKINLICVWGPLIDALNTDRNLFLCIEPQIFSNTLNSLLNLMENFPVNFSNKLESENHKHINFEKELSINFKPSEEKNKSFDSYNITHQLNEESIFEGSIIKKIVNFFHSFSYFTYFQFIQNDLIKILINSFLIDSNKKENYDNENISDYLKTLSRMNQKITSLKNLLFNFNIYNENLFAEKRLFVKNISNYLNFIFTLLNLISNNLLKYFSYENYELKKIFEDDLFEKMIKGENNLENDSQIESQLKGNVKEFLKNIYKYFKFISDLSKNLCKIVDRESFIFQQAEDIKKLKIMIKKLNQSSNLDKKTNEIINKSYLRILYKLDPEINQNFLDIFNKIT